MHAEEPQVLKDVTVHDAQGNIVPAYDRYQPGEITVLCNQSGAELSLPFKTPLGRMSLKPGESTDLEDHLRPSAIRYSGVNQLLKHADSVTIHKKGSKPVGTPPNTQTGPVAKPTTYDKALDEVMEREEAEDARTSRKGRKRTGESGAIGAATVKK